MDFSAFSALNPAVPIFFATALAVFTVMLRTSLKLAESRSRRAFRSSREQHRRHFGRG